MGECLAPEGRGHPCHGGQAPKVPPPAGVRSSTIGTLTMTGKATFAPPSPSWQLLAGAPLVGMRPTSAT
eukprot:18015-Eustigmatos_ZCMA.PRE.1